MFKPFKCPNCGEGTATLLARLKKPLELMFDRYNDRTAERLMAEFTHRLNSVDDGLRAEFCEDCGALTIIPQKVALH